MKILESRNASNRLQLKKKQERKKYVFIQMHMMKIQIANKSTQITLLLNNNNI